MINENHSELLWQIFRKLLITFLMSLLLQSCMHIVSISRTLSYLSDVTCCLRYQLWSYSPHNLFLFVLPTWNMFMTAYFPRHGRIAYLPNLKVWFWHSRFWLEFHGLMVRHKTLMVNWHFWQFSFSVLLEIYFHVFENKNNLN